MDLWRAISRDCERIKSSRFREEVAEEFRLKAGAAPILEGDERSEGVNCSVHRLLSGLVGAVARCADGLRKIHGHRNEPDHDDADGFWILRH